MPALPNVDLVILYIGGNDWWTLEKEGNTAFIEGYTRFLLQIRSQRPTQPLLILTADAFSGSCLVTPARLQKFSEDMAKVLSIAAANAGGVSSGIYLREVNPEPAIDVNRDDDWGLMEHWSVPAHIKWARGVVPLIHEITGWHSRSIPAPHSS
jgi:hypothetical protein